MSRLSFTPLTFQPRKVSDLETHVIPLVVAQAQEIRLSLLGRRLRLRATVCSTGVMRGRRRRVVGRQCGTATLCRPSPCIWTRWCALAVRRWQSGGKGATRLPSWSGRSRTCAFSGRRSEWGGNERAIAFLRAETPSQSEKPQTAISAIPIGTPGRECSLRTNGLALGAFGQVEHWAGSEVRRVEMEQG